KYLYLNKYFAQVWKHCPAFAVGTWGEGALAVDLAPCRRGKTSGARSGTVMRKSAAAQAPRQPPLTGRVDRRPNPGVAKANPRATIAGQQPARTARQRRQRRSERVNSTRAPSGVSAKEKSGASLTPAGFPVPLMASPPSPRRSVEVSRIG